MCVCLRLHFAAYVKVDDAEFTSSLHVICMHATVTLLVKYKIMTEKKHAKFESCKSCKLQITRDFIPTYRARMSHFLQI